MTHFGVFTVVHFKGLSSPELNALVKFSDHILTVIKFSVNFSQFLFVSRNIGSGQCLVPRSVTVVMK